MDPLEYVKSIDRSAPLVGKTELAAQLGITLNEMDDIIGRKRQSIESVLHDVIGCNGVAVFAGGYVLTITTDYVHRRTWSPWMAYREFLQNALDTRVMIGYGYVGDYAFVSDEGPGVTPSEILFLGASQKSECTDRGYFGEGAKMAMLTLEANGLETIMFTNPAGLPLAISYAIHGDRVIMLVYVIDRFSCAKETHLSMPLIYGGTVVTIRDPSREIDEDAKRMGMRGIEDSVAPERNAVVEVEFPPPYGSGFEKNCNNSAPHRILYEPKYLYVRNIYVKDELPFLSNLFGYDLWWVWLDPNRNNVDISRTSVLSVVREIYSKLDKADVHPRFIKMLANTLKEGAVCEKLAGITPSLRLKIDSYEAYGFLFMPKQYFDEAVSLLGKKCGIDQFYAYAIDPSPSTLAEYAHIVGSRPILILTGVKYPIMPDVIEQELDKKLVNIKNAIAESYAELASETGFDPRVIPDHEILSQLLAYIAKWLTSIEIKVTFNRSRSFAVDETVSIEQSLVSAEETQHYAIASARVHEFWTVFLHELAHVYAEKKFGVGGDLTEQHFRAIESLGARVATLMSRDTYIGTVLRSLSDYLLSMPWLVMYSKKLSSLYRLRMRIPRAELAIIYKEEGLPEWIGFYAVSVLEDPDLNPKLDIKHFTETYFRLREEKLIDEQYIAPLDLIAHTPPAVKTAIQVLYMFTHEDEAAKRIAERICNVYYIDFDRIKELRLVSLSKYIDKIIARARELGADFC